MEAILISALWLILVVIIRQENKDLISKNKYLERGNERYKSARDEATKNNYKLVQEDRKKTAVLKEIAKISHSKNETSEKVLLGKIQNLTKEYLNI